MKFLLFVPFFHFLKNWGFDCLASFFRDLFVTSAKQSVLYSLL